MSQDGGLGEKGPVIYVCRDGVAHMMRKHWGTTRVVTKQKKEKLGKTELSTQQPFTYPWYF